MERPSTTEVIAAIVKSFETLPERLGAVQARGDRAWTLQIKKDMAALGEKYEQAICGLKPPHDGGWLYDLVWYRVAGEQRNLVEVYLVLESEWGNEVLIKYDFEKLLLAKSAVKVMVFQGRARKLGDLFDFLYTAS